MLNINISQTAIAIAQELETVGLKAEALPNTVVAQLNSAAAAGLAANEFGTGELTPDPAYIQALTGGDAGVESAHTTLLELTGRDHGDILTSHISFARTNVRTIIVEAVEGLTKHIEGLASEYEFQMKVTVRDLPAPMKEPGLSDALENYKGRENRVVPHYVPLPEALHGNFAEYLKTGAADVDAAIAVWLSQEGEAKIQSVFLALFSDRGHPDRPGCRLPQLLSNAKCHSEALAAYLFANNLLSAPPKGVQMALGEYKKRLGEIRDEAALRLTQLLSMFEEQEKSGLLILDYTQEEIVVHGGTYAKFKAEGGVDAVLFGNILGGKVRTYINAINAEREQYLKLWQDQSAAITSAEHNRRESKLVRALREHLVAVVVRNAGLVFGHLQGAEILANPGGIYQFGKYQEWLRNLDVGLSAVVESDFQNLWRLVTRTVCSTLFAYTDAEQILRGIDDAIEANPEMDAKQGLLLSLIDLAADYAYGQLNLTDA